nr:SIS domain-containing protein [Planctomycetota bacterium]
WSIVNAVGSQAMRLADGYIAMHAGPEIGVASTKAFTTSLVDQYLLALYLGQLRGALSRSALQGYTQDLLRLPDLVGRVLERETHVREPAHHFYHYTNFLYLGRGINYPIALEGALKLKEISYIHAEGYPAGEMKHGPIALLDEQMPVVAIALKDNVYDKMLSQKFENESIALLARWFHCVRFSESIMDDAHSWRALFSGEYPPQCFVVTWDGHNNEILSGIFSISRIQTSMRKILAKEYSKDVDQALTKWKRVLDKFDTLDAKVGDMRERIEALSIERGPDSAQVRTMKARLAKLEKEQSAIEKEEAAVLDLGLARKASDGKSKLLDRLRTQR